MKKALSIVFALFLTMVASSQTRSLLLTESFDSDIIPEGWYIADDGTENWSISTSAKSGGTPNELCLNWAPEFYGTTRLVMPPLDLSGISSVLVSFKHYHDNYIGENLLGIATSSDNGTTWNSAWSQIYIDIQAFNENHVITTPDMNKDNVLICIYFEGNSYLFNNWFFDDIQVYEQEELDVNVISIDMPKFIPKGENEVKFTVKNLGSTNIETFDAELSFSNDDMILSQTFQTNLAPFETAQFSFGTHYFDICDPFTITVNVNSVNSTDDDDASNNILEKNINVALGSSERVVLIEHFTSSSCTYPCIPTNQSMNALTNANPGEYSYVKYAIDIPDPGDPYCSEDNMARKSYYAVSGVPQVFLDAADQGYGPASQQSFDLASNVPAYVDIRGSFDVEANTINVIADFMSYVNIDNVRAFIAVNEKTTTENIGNDEETEYHHILMKMLENADGNEINIVAGNYQRLEMSYDLSSTYVEDMNDLEVTLWLQDYTTKEVYNSRFAYEYTEHCYPVQNVEALANMECVQMLSILWDTPEQGNPIGYNIYVDGVLIEENYQNTYYENPDIAYIFEDSYVHTAEVVAVYENGMTSVATPTIIDVTTGLNELNNYISCKIYPNPANNYVRITGDNIKSVNVFNCVGALIYKSEIINDNIELNTENYNPGLYLIEIQSNEGFTKTIKLVLK